MRDILHPTCKTEPITDADVRSCLLGSDLHTHASLRRRQAPPPLQLRLLTQLEDGSTREWAPLTHVGQLVEALRSVLAALPHRATRNGSLRIPDGAVFVDMTATHASDSQDEMRPRASTDLAVSFFWIDMTGVPGGDDLDVLMDLLHVHQKTRRAWRAGAMDAHSEDSTSSEEDDRASDAESTTGPLGAAEMEAALSGEWLTSERGLDQLQVFVSEQYVQMQLAAILSHGPAARCVPQPDRLHANLFDVDEEGDLGCVRLLCFRDGIVTWRPQPEVEGWTHIARTVERRLSQASGNTNTFHNATEVRNTGVMSRRTLTTALLLHTILDEVCEAFLPDPTVVLNEVDAIDSMLPMMRPAESDQADILRRVLLLRRGLSVHRRLLLSKVNVLEQLGRPVMRTMLAFITQDMDNDGGVLHRPNLLKQRAKRVPVGRSYGPASIAQRILHLLRQLDSARTILGNATIIYTSGVAMRNNSMSNESDYRMLVLQYVLLIVLPLTIVASQWGMNCWVPWQGEESTKPFWTMTGCMFFYAVTLLAYPIYCWVVGKPHKLVF